MSTPALIALIYACGFYWALKREAEKLTVCESFMVADGILLALVRGLTTYGLCEASSRLIAVIQ